MSVYVDNLVSWGWRLRGRHTDSCHMIADTPEELHAMAAAIGMKRAWFQNQRSCPHYDLVPSRRTKAVELGAVELDRRGFVAAMRRIRTSQAWATPL